MPQISPEQSSTPQWTVYIIRCRNGQLYTGITTDLQRRLAEHQGKAGKGAKSLRGKAPLQIVWRRHVDNRSEASRLEYRIKQLTRTRKERLIAAGNAGVTG